MPNLKRLVISLSTILLGVFMVIPVPAYAETVEVDHGYTYDYEIESWDNYSESFGIAHDSENNIYVIGRFLGTVDFDVTGGTDNISEVGGDYDVYLQKINADGSYGWTRTWQITYPSSIAVDNQDRILANILYSGTADFDPTGGVDNKTSVSSSFDIGVIRLNSDGTYDMGVSFGGSGIDYARHMATDQSNNIVLAGRFTGTCDFDPGAGTSNKVSSGGIDAFVTKINEDGSHAFAVAVGGASDDETITVATDADSNIYYGWWAL